MVAAVCEMMRIAWISDALGGAALALLLMPPAAAAEASSKASAAFAQYVRLTEARLDAELGRDDRFLWLDSLPASRRESEMTRLKRGEVILERLETRAAGQTIDVPDGMIHHWIATVFLPGVGLDRVIPILQDYDRHAQLFAPAVVRSKLRSRSGDDFTMYLRVMRTKVLTVVLDTENDVHYTRPRPGRGEFRARSTSIREVADAGTSRESVKPPGQGRGFMWRLNTYGRLEERDGGTVVQFETVSLSRAIPLGLGWIIGPFVTSVPKESLVFTLETLRGHVSTAISGH
jgi:hypothetical protein